MVEHSKIETDPSQYEVKDRTKVFKPQRVHYERLDPQFTNTQFQFNVKQLMSEYEHKLNTELINNLNQIKSHPQQKLNGKD